MATDPFQLIAQLNNDMSNAGRQDSAQAQNMLAQVFQTEAARQAPYSSLPAQMALQNNASQNSYDKSVNLHNYKQQQGDFKIPSDAVAFGSNIIGNLSRDLGISVEAASGIVGNLASETGNFRHLQELKPVVPGSRGGAGWAMWTGPRRKDFEAFTNGDTTSPEANYRYLVHDIKNNYPQIHAALKDTNDPLKAAEIFHNQFLRPGVPHLRKSALNTQKYYEGYNIAQNKRVTGDAEYDRRKARGGTGDTKQEGLTAITEKYKDPYYLQSPDGETIEIID